MNELLLETTIVPEYGQVRIEALGSTEVPDDSGDDWFDKGFIANEDSVYVVTMTADEAEEIGSNVQVRVYHGSGTDGLGKPIFDQELMFRQPVLAIGRVLDDDSNLQKVQLERTGPIRLQVFAATTQPVEGPNEINVLIRYD